MKHRYETGLLLVLLLIVLAWIGEKAKNADWVFWMFVAILCWLVYELLDWK